MVLLEIQKYLEDNVKVLDHLYAITQVILSKKSEALSDTDKTKIDIENAIFSIIEHIKTKRLEWMDKAYEIISQDYSYVVERIAQTQNPLGFFANYIYKTNENVYRILTTLFNASSDENLYNLFEKLNIKNLCLAVIKSKYDYLSDKNDKTISNIFANYNEILKQYSAKTEDDNIQYLSHTRYDALDDKEYEEETLEDKIIENLYILYLNFVNYVEKPNDKQKIQILNIIEKLDKLVSKK